MEKKPTRAFYSFLKSYKPKRAIIVTLNKFKKRKINNTIVYWIPVFYL